MNKAFKMLLQANPIATTLDTVFVVQVVDQFQNPVPGVTVDFSIDSIPNGATGQKLTVLNLGRDTREYFVILWRMLIQGLAAMVENRIRTEAETISIYISGFDLGRDVIDRKVW